MTALHDPETSYSLGVLDHGSCPIIFTAGRAAIPRTGTCLVAIDHDPSRPSAPKWRTEILAYHDTGASNGPTEGPNLCVKKVKRCGHGFRFFEHYRLRVLLHTGGITWPSRPRSPRIRSRHTPHSNV